MKEMYDVDIRLNTPIELNGRKFEANETILNFDTIEISQIGENKTRTAATGGYNNNILIDWETDKEATFAITHGVLSHYSLALVSNSNLKKINKMSVPFKETVQVIEDNNSWYSILKFIPNYDCQRYGIQGNPDNEPLPMGRREWLELKKLPLDKNKYIFCYDLDTRKKILKFDIIGNKIIFKAEHKNVLVDYTFDYDKEITELEVGNRLINGFLNLTGKITTKDYLTGEPTTAILTIPKLKIVSSLTINLGSGRDCASVGEFFFVGYPGETRDKNDLSVCKFYFLPTELTGDYL